MAVNSSRINKEDVDLLMHFTESNDPVVNNNKQPVTAVQLSTTPIPVVDNELEDENEVDTFPSGSVSIGVYYTKNATLIKKFFWGLSHFTSTKELIYYICEPKSIVYVYHVQSKRFYASNVVPLLCSGCNSDATLVKHLNELWVREHKPLCPGRNPGVFFRYQLERQNQISRLMSNTPNTPENLN